MVEDTYKSWQIKKIKEHIKEKKNHRIKRKKHKNEIRRRCFAKRERNMGYTVLFDNMFKGDVHGHHISDAFVFYIPKDKHMSNLGRDHREQLKSYVEEAYGISYLIVEK